MALPLNNRVLHSPFSVAHNDHHHVYSCFPGPFLTESGRGFGAAMTAGYEGIPGNSSYPPYRYSLEPDPVIARWADNIARWVPGFPDAMAMRDRDTLVSAVAFFIYDVSVLHAADHHSTSCHPLTRYPLRLRVPPPTSKDVPPFRHADLVSREDMFRHRMVAGQLHAAPGHRLRVRRPAPSRHPAALPRAAPRGGRRRGQERSHPAPAHLVQYSVLRGGQCPAWRTIARYPA